MIALEWNDAINFVKTLVRLTRDSDKSGISDAGHGLIYELFKSCTPLNLTTWEVLGDDTAFIEQCVEASKPRSLIARDLTITPLAAAIVSSLPEKDRERPGVSNMARILATIKCGHGIFVVGSSKGLIEADLCSLANRAKTGEPVCTFLVATSEDEARKQHPDYVFRYTEIDWYK